ncbi:acetyltransferase [Eubacterium oxidoreducens]|uniref:Transferase hexapeptide (Six repeat-containing protein) n=1 Tax=Eubacterium oxidoreducens TaxID=1732 RepID=A0A1G6AR63_EUBOX|nr:acetyltransferase [Eubacterium oxidoreducens]SDB10849.1 transferase hexapeptide (six repeat-containing protein) [Eubacterium oxidoreducens]
MALEVVIIGASGHGKVIADIVKKSGDIVLGFLDDAMEQGDEFCGYPVLGKVPDFPKYIEKYSFVIGIGNHTVRERIALELSGKKASFYTAIHPSAQISSVDVTIGEGSVVMANAVINSGARIGRQCIINTAAVVEHDNRISDYVHIAVGAKLAGTVDIGKYSWIGIGATVLNNLDICDRCLVGAGAVVIEHLTKPGTYIGVPAKKIN